MKIEKKNLNFYDITKYKQNLYLPNYLSEAS